MTYDPTTADIVHDESLRLSTRLLRAALPAGAIGSLRVETPAGEILMLRGAPGPEACLVLHRWRSVWRLLGGGDVAFAEAYIDGDWSTPDLPAFLGWALQNEALLSGTTRGTLASRIALRLRHLLRANTKRGSQQNISAHYDLGNAFYTQWLDRGMAYSSALYEHTSQTLESAQDAKLDRVAALLNLEGGEHVLEIGFGWGGVLNRLIGGHGCRMTGLTLSTEQLAFTRDRLRQAGLLDHADLRLQDYRDVQGPFDRIVSIEMFEAVGERYWQTYFDKLRDCLNRGGTAVLQVITIAEERYATYRQTPDFIQRHVFPGGMLPTKTSLRDLAHRAGFALTAEEAFGRSYARTLQEWRRRFFAAWPSIEPLGFDARFRRLWDYYLAYCEAGFVHGSVDVSLFACRKL